MDCRLNLIIHERSYVYDHLILMPHDEMQYKKESTENKKNFCGSSTLGKAIPVHVNRKGLCSYLVSAYISNLQRSDLYRKSAIKSLILFVKEKVPYDENCFVLIKLRNPRKHFVDYAWNERITQMASEKREIDHAMSWLSTLGGAFSALGEEIPYCAEVAGKISLKQFKLAYRLGDPLLVARCKLYAALSLIQRGNLKQPKHMIKDIYRFAVKERDVRLQNMCQGVWAKLKYYHNNRKQFQRS